MQMSMRMGMIARGLVVFLGGETFLAEPCPITALAALVCIFATCLMSATFVWCPRLTSRATRAWGDVEAILKKEVWGWLLR